MPLPILAGLARAALGKVAKSGAAKAVGRSISSKEVAVAKKRYIRASERFAKAAERVGERTRYGQLLKKASYRTQHFADSLSSTKAVNADGWLADLVSQSDRYLVSKARDDENRGDLLGETLLNGTMQGHRFFSITRELWIGKADDYGDRYSVIKEAFGDRSLSEIILEIEQSTGVNIMKGDINSEERYGALTRAERIKVERYILENYG